MFNDEENMKSVLEDFALEMRKIFLEKKEVVVDILLYDMFTNNLWGARVTYYSLLQEIMAKYQYHHTHSNKHVFYAAEFLTDEELNDIVESIILTN